MGHGSCGCWLNNIFLLKPNAREAVNYDFSRYSNVLLTEGRNGMSLFKGSSKILDIPSEAKEVFDVTGAGDTVTAVLAVAISAGYSLIDSVKLSNKAAGIVVGKLGTSTVTQGEIL